MQNEQAIEQPHFDEVGRRSNAFLLDFMKQQRAALVRDADREPIEIESEHAL